jgi:uncharacterized protein YqhQ
LSEQAYTQGIDSDDAQREKVSSVFDESDLVCRTHVGGQALIEGIMMRGRYNWALAVRKPNGSIYVEEHDLASGRDKNSWMYKPVVRGCTAMVESLALGYKALEIAANHAYEEYEEPDEEEAEEQTAESEQLTPVLQQSAVASALPPLAAPTETILPHAVEPPVEAEPSEQAVEEEVEEEAAEQAVEEFAAEEVKVEDAALPKSVMTISMIVGVLLGVAIFIVVPAVVTNLLVGDYGEKTLLWNLVDGVLRVAIFIAYIFLIGRLPDIRRMFGYHGAEHRTIHCYERGRELTVVNAQTFPSLHVRCGTAFMLMTMIIAILVFTLVPVNWLIDGLGIQNEALRLGLVILSRIILLPLIAGLSYEFTVKWAGNRPDNPLVKVVLWPGLQMQRLTTNPPDDDMVECAIAAMNAVLAREQREAEKAAT